MSSAPSIEPRRHKGIFFGSSSELLHRVWGPAQREHLGQVVDIIADDVLYANMSSHSEALAETEVIFTTWGMPELTPEELSRFPKLKAVFYAAGSVRPFASPLLDKGILVVSGWAANAIPVAEFTLSQILFSLKSGWQHVQQIRANPTQAGWGQREVRGVYGATVGLISLGMIGRKVCEFLRPFTLRKIAYDPYVGSDTLRELGVTRASLEEIFRESDVVSLHSPLLPATHGMITGEMIASMRKNATFINTSRGRLVREDEMIEVLRARPDLTAVLDVTVEEPPFEGSALYTLPNVVLTPHIAGSLGDEVHRLADFMIEEYIAWNEGQPLRYAVSRDLMDKIA